MGHTLGIAATATILATVLSAECQTVPAAQANSSSPIQEESTAAPLALKVPAGTRVVLALKSPVWAKTAKAGDMVYAATIFPVAVNNQMAIPPGTYVAGQIDALTRPSLFSNHANLLMHFTKIIYLNGYAVELPGAPFGGSPGVAGGAVEPATQGTNPPPEGVRIQSAVARVYVQVSSRNDLLLDNGSQIEMVLQDDVSLDAMRVADATRRFKVPRIAPVPTASLCQPIPGTPGTPDTVIKGTSGTPGTPDIVIPGGPGMPPTVIPGTPATPGTPDTVIPGTPATPDVPCPNPPYVIGNPIVRDVHTESFRLLKPVTINGKPVAAGSYQVSWTGWGPLAQARILEHGKLVAAVEARVVTLDKSSPESQADLQDDRDGSSSLKSLRFAGRDYALLFN